MPCTRPTLIVLGSLLLGCGFGSVARAAPIQPFDAVVQSSGGDEIYVRSGPGQEKHYPTLKLSNGDQVHVLRKDPGGWYMIDPPPGSYSWILGRYVQKNGTQGTVTENGVLVRVGASSVNPIDTYIRSGMVAMPMAFPFIIGADLAGTVWEWVRSVSSPDELIFRGGSWYQDQVTSASINCEHGEPTLRRILLGLRVCADPLPR